MARTRTARSPRPTGPDFKVIYSNGVGTASVRHGRLAAARRQRLRGGVPAIAGRAAPGTPAARFALPSAAMPKILVVEDEPAIAESMAYSLRRDGFTVDHRAARCAAAEREVGAAPIWWCST